MANRLNTNPLYFDQWDANATLAKAGESFIVKKIRLLTATQWDVFVLEDIEGNVLFKMNNDIGNARMSEVNFGRKGFDFGNNGVKITVADCTGIDTTDSTEAVWIYLR